MPFALTGPHVGVAHLKLDICPLNPKASEHVFHLAFAGNEITRVNNSAMHY